MDIVQVLPGDKVRAKQFMRLPYRLYADAPQWAPETFRRDQLRQLDPRKHPYYEHSEAAFFLAMEGGDVVGRIGVLNNRRSNDHRNTKTAFFGFAEFVDDPQVVNGLLQSARSWARTKGLRTMEGPRGLLGFDGSIRVDGFDIGPVLGAPFNFPYYDARLQEAGLVPEEDFLSGRIATSASIPDAIFAIADRVLARGAYRLQTFSSRSELRSWVPAIRDAYLASVSELASFYPPTDQEIADLVDTLMRIANPRGISLVMAEEAIVGFLFSYPNMAPALRKASGRLLPTGWYHLLRARSREPWYCINGLGLLPEHRGRGGNALLYAQIARTAADLQWAGGLVLQVASSNAASLRDMEKLETEWTTRHRRYTMDL